MATIYEIFGSDAHAMTYALLERAAVADTLAPDTSIALKPNLVTDATPEDGATTHPGVLSGCIEYFQAHGFHRLSIIESSWVGCRTERAMRCCGYDRVCERYGVPFLDLKGDTTRTVQTALRPMAIASHALDAGLLVNLPVLKGHSQTRMTCALKNLKGCLPDREKRQFHAEGLHQPIAALAAYLRPGLTIVDAICGDLSFEEGGNPVATHRMYLGTDMVQLDTYGCMLMGLEPEDVRYIPLAERYGAGSMSLSPTDIVSLGEPMADSVPFPKPDYTVRQLARPIQERGACSACYASLVRALYIARERMLPVPDSIAIGQGYKNINNINNIKFGVGRCCAGAKVCVPGCPPSALDIVRALEKR